MVADGNMNTFLIFLLSATITQNQIRKTNKEIGAITYWKVFGNVIFVPSLYLLPYLTASPEYT